MRPEVRTFQKMAEGVGNAPTSAMPILFSRQAQPAYICLPSLNAECAIQDSAFSILHYAFKMAARVGLAPTPNGLTGRRATLTLSGSD